MASPIHSRSDGVFVIAATPFTDSGAVDLDSIDTLTDFYLSFGIDGLTIMGIMGEAQKLSQDESLAVMKRFLQRVDGRVPVIVGVSSPAFDPMVSLARAAIDQGAAGVMIAPPPTVRHDEQFFAYYAGACKALGPQVPVCLQDYPAVTGVHMSVPVFSQIVSELPQVVMLKAEDCPGLTKISRIRALEAQGPAARVDPGRQQRPVLPAGAGARRRRRDDRRGLSRDADRGLPRDALRRPRPGRRPVRDLPAAGALRDPARRRAGLAQGDPAPPRCHRQRPRAPAGRRSSTPTSTRT